MTVQPDEHIRCRCGSGTYLVGGVDSLRTCSVCGYLTSYCKCKRTQVSRTAKSGGFKLTDRTRGLIGAAVVSAMGTILVMTVISSPFFALLGLGIPFALTTGFFAQWLRGEGPAEATAPPEISPPPAATGRIRA